MNRLSRGVLTPVGSRKRKERKVSFSATSTKPLVQPAAVSLAVSLEDPATTSSKVSEPDQQPLSSNRLLAGYMAHEFLTMGTLFGHKLDRLRAEDPPMGPLSERKRNQRQRQSQAQPSSGTEPSGKPKQQSYAEVATLLKSDGAHIPGIVNPTELARWIQM